ncbi:integral membrane protein [Heliomicrobium modesticaldum Ice1]|uniref:UPF0756 membrane protein Helmi_09930 n=1 Tax=Heliobacterium modesticaldum (strain ATCC 51547 / Ice1) TaxID=498761 RepID=Y993_HELMI|nr:DUF441 domain-containing protein [Heliomicrobium modesticaldum]B0TA81.1 RecName: Full=UPF0756 membrane protein Helmi_09930 [Heliomicrobium modesticaldum Ice1]ABZ83618.1 integral membrane protein [Heliomicrobium modesticaldum Ice1]
MRGGTVLLILILLLGVIARSPMTALAAASILALSYLGWGGLLEWIEQNGVDTGLIMLTLAMLAPFATGKVGLREVLLSFASLPGIIAVIGGVLATNLNKRGIDLLSGEPQIIVGMIVGSLLGIVLFGGIPVGPLMAGGLTALILQIYGWLSK